jgi:hypothetical protein
VLHMAKRTTATEQDRVDVMRIVLEGLAHDEPLDDVLRKLRPYADHAFPFPGDGLTEIGASALEVAGATPATPVSLSDASERYLPEWKVSGNTARQKHRAAINAAIAAHAGIVVDYYETAGWWRVQDFRFHAFDVAVILIRLAADHTDRSVQSICEEIAVQHHARID